MRDKTNSFVCGAPKTGMAQLSYGRPEAAVQVAIDKLCADVERGGCLDAWTVEVVVYLLVNNARHWHDLVFHDVKQGVRIRCPFD